MTRSRARGTAHSAFGARVSPAGRILRRLSAWRRATLYGLALAGGGGLAVTYWFARVWPSPPWLPVIVGTALLSFVAAGLAGLLLAAALGSRLLRLKTRWRVIAALVLAVGWLAACRWVLLHSVPYWLFNQGSREAVTTIRPAAGGGPVFDIYRVTDERPLLTVRRGFWSELVHEAEEEGDFADHVDVVVHGHHLVFDPGGATRDRSATIDGRPAVVESRR